MGRKGKFSFPIPGRKSQKKAETDDYASSIPSDPSAHEWPSRHDESSSKAHRVLGTSEPMFRTTSKQSVPPSPGYMSITVSEASYNSRADDKASGTATDHNGYLGRPGVSRRASSNVIGRAYTGDERRGSDSTTSRRLQPETSDSTLRSHYDPKSSPMGISQQTSDSAVRDMALRRGKPQIVMEYNSNGYAASPLSPIMQEEARRKEQRRKKPARLDLSKLFPKPRGGDGQAYSNALLSPAKMVNSPSAMSTMSEHFPRPMTREPTPNPVFNPTINPRGPAKLRKTPPQGASAPQCIVSPPQQHAPDQYDNAKIHIRRPPKGAQHWFDALDEDSDEPSNHNPPTMYAPQAVRPNAVPKEPLRKTSLGQLASDTESQHTKRLQRRSTTGRRDTFSHEDLIDICIDSPSQLSLQSMQSARTKESALSKSNLQNSSVLSFSSSEDEDAVTQTKTTRTQRVAVRRSLDTNEDAGEIVIGRAQAFEVRPQHYRRPSEMSARTVSTSAATIDIMYTPEPPFTPLHYPRHSSHSGSRVSSHTRQPSVIPEGDDDDVVRPKTAFNGPLSPSQSVRSTRTSASEPKLRSGSETSHKLMAVTAEEEALLELMRKKRAAMAGKIDITPPDHPVPEPQHHRPLKTPSEGNFQRYRTSGFLAEASPVRHPEPRRAPHAIPTPLLLAPRGRPVKTHYDAPSHLRDSSTSSAWSELHISSALPHHLPTPSEFSPLDPFPSSPVLTASVGTEHASPLPSPVTPGLRAYEEDLNVKVASSDTSAESDELAIAIDIHAKSSRSHSSHRHSRTKSSGANVSFPAPPTLVVETPAVPKLQQRDVKRIAEGSRSRNGSVNSQSSRTSGGRVRGASRSREGSVASVSGRVREREREGKEDRSSVSDDVLAAWGSLGGTY
jgi:hypothetical protein